MIYSYSPFGRGGSEGGGAGIEFINSNSVDAFQKNKVSRLYTQILSGNKVVLYVIGNRIFELHALVFVPRIF